MKYVLLLTLFLGWQPTPAQDAKNAIEATRFIKLVNTLRMAQFNEKQIIAGVLLIEAIFRAYANTSVSKRLVFIRDSDIGWVTGKFLENMNRNYERATAGGAR